MDAFITLIHEENSIELKTPYDSEFIKGIKVKVPKHMRKWDGERKIWTIYNLYYLHELKDLCKLYFSNTVVKEIVSVKEVSGDLDELFKMLTSEDKKAIYRVFAVRVHPDKGGSTRAMQLVNKIFGK